MYLRFAEVVQLNLLYIQSTRSLVHALWYCFYAVAVLECCCITFWSVFWCRRLFLQFLWKQRRSFICNVSHQRWGLVIRGISVLWQVSSCYTHISNRRVCIYQKIMDFMRDWTRAGLNRTRPYSAKLWGPSRKNWEFSVTTLVLYTSFAAIIRFQIRLSGLGGLIVGFRFKF